MAHLCHYLTALAARKPNAELTVCQGRVKTVLQVLRGVAALSQRLQHAHGVQPGDRVVIVAQNTDFFLQALLAICAAGAIAVPINLRWSLQEAMAAVSLVDARVLCIEDELLPAFGQLGRAPGRACLALGSNGQQEDCSLQPEGQSESGAGSHAEKAGMQSAASSAGTLQVHSNASGAALICFTSGTSGSPKGVLLSHGALHSQALAKLLAVGYSERDVYLHCAPLCHIGGLSSATALLAAGGKQVFLPAFSAAAALDLIAQHSVTALIAVPAMVASLLEAASSRRSSNDGSSSSSSSSSSAFPSVRRVLLGGGELPARLIWRLRLLFPGAALMTAYGMTETCSSITFQALEKPQPDFAAEASTAVMHLPGVCVGRPPPGIDIAILELPDPAASAGTAPAEASQGSASVSRVTARAGAAGEVLTRGPHVMLGYWGDASATQRAFLQPGGWLRTGDLGALDAAGRLWLQGRLKDVVRSGSENVSAAEVERVLIRLPGVAAAAVVGLPHPHLGEQVSALLVLREGVRWQRDDRGAQQQEGRGEPILSPARVVAFCKAKGLSPFMAPRVVLAQHEPLPTNSSGKVLKQAVRQRMLRLLGSEHGQGLVSRM